MILLLELANVFVLVAAGEAGGLAGHAQAPFVAKLRELSEEAVNVRGTAELDAIYADVDRDLEKLAFYQSLLRGEAASGQP